MLTDFDVRKHRAPQGALRRDRLTHNALSETESKSNERHKVH